MPLSGFTKIVIPVENGLAGAATWRYIIDIDEAQVTFDAGVELYLDKLSRVAQVGEICGDCSRLARIDRGGRGRHAVHLQIPVW